jgi:hypothetical protein
MLAHAHDAHASARTNARTQGTSRGSKLDGKVAEIVSGAQLVLVANGKLVSRLERRVGRVAIRVERPHLLIVACRRHSSSRVVRQWVHAFVRTSGQATGTRRGG